MEIITVDDQLFPELVRALRNAACVGRYWRQGKIQTVSATARYLLISEDSTEAKIAMKPTRSLQEAESYALRILSRERERGNRVELAPTYER